MGAPLLRMHIALAHPNQPDVVTLIAELDAYQSSLYPPESNHFLDIAALAQPNVLFAVARKPERKIVPGGGESATRTMAGSAIACGAIVLGAEYGEVKRMYVHPEGRGAGIAKALLAFLEAEAGARGCRLFTLETGISQPEALAFYERAGYSRRAPFGRYRDDPFSVFMQKHVG